MKVEASGQIDFTDDPITKWHNISEEWVKDRFSKHELDYMISNGEDWPNIQMRCARAARSEVKIQI